MSDLAFWRWFVELKNQNAESKTYNDLNQDDWRDFWQDGYSPAEAIAEDQSND